MEDYRHVGVGTFKGTEAMADNLAQVLKSGQISYGPFSKEFEQRFAALHDCKYAILSNSGTSSLLVALQALKELYGWQDGDEVLVPAVTFVATINIILHNRLKPVLVDIERSTYGINPRHIKGKITPKTRCILPVHLFGQPCNMTEVMRIANRYNLKVLEDSCETMFVKHREQVVGSMGDVGCFSTYVAHLLTTGVGGLCTTNDRRLARRIRSLVNHGIEIDYLDPDDNFSPKPVVGRRFLFETVGHSFRITELEAAVGLAQLDTYPEMLAQRGRNAHSLTGLLQKVTRQHNQAISLPHIKEGNEHAFMMYPIVMNEPKQPVMEYLNAHGIETRDMLPVTDQPIYHSWLATEEYPIADLINRQGFYVGCHQDLDLDDMRWIAAVLESYLESEHV